MRALIKEMTHAEYYVFLAGGNRMLRVSAMGWARVARAAGNDPSEYVRTAREHQRRMLYGLSEYRAAKKRERLGGLQSLLQEVRAITEPRFAT